MAAHYIATQVGYKHATEVREEGACQENIENHAHSLQVRVLGTARDR